MNMSLNHLCVLSQMKLSRGQQHSDECYGYDKYDPLEQLERKQLVVIKAEEDHTTKPSSATPSRKLSSSSSRTPSRTPSPSSAAVVESHNPVPVHTETSRHLVTPGHDSRRLQSNFEFTTDPVSSDRISPTRKQILVTRRLDDGSSSTDGIDLEQSLQHPQQEEPQQKRTTISNTGGEVVKNAYHGASRLEERRIGNEEGDREEKSENEFHLTRSTGNDPQSYFSRHITTSQHPPRHPQSEVATIPSLPSSSSDQREEDDFSSKHFFIEQHPLLPYHSYHSASTGDPRLQDDEMDHQRTIPVPTVTISTSLTTTTTANDERRQQEQQRLKHAPKAIWSILADDSALIQSIIPNLRDLSISSGLAPRMREGVLFRSARHFASSPHTLKAVLCDKLHIRSILDLRDDDLTASPAELASRTLVMRLFGLQMPLRMTRKTEKAFRQLERICNEMGELEKKMEQEHRQRRRSSGFRREDAEHGSNPEDPSPFQSSRTRDQQKETGSEVEDVPSSSHQPPIDTPNCHRLLPISLIEEPTFSNPLHDVSNASSSQPPPLRYPFPGASLVVSQHPLPSLPVDLSHSCVGPSPFSVVDRCPPPSVPRESNKHPASLCLSEGDSEAEFTAATPRFISSYISPIPPIHAAAQDSHQRMLSSPCASSMETAAATAHLPHHSQSNSSIRHSISCSPLLSTTPHTSQSHPIERSTPLDASGLASRSQMASPDDNVASPPPAVSEHHHQLQQHSEHLPLQQDQDEDDQGGSHVQESDVGAGVSSQNVRRPNHPLTSSSSRRELELRRQRLGYAEYPGTTNSHLVQPSTVPHCQSLSSVFAFEKQYRKLYIINVLNSPGVQERIKEAVVGSYAMPLMLVARIADKLSGSALAPYYFCKYFVSMGDVLESYMEMLKYCGENFCHVLKVITLTEVPILFHCTLGKDRTGIIAMLLLSILGASDEGIVYDYGLTEHAGDAFQAFNYDFIVRQSGLADKFTSSSEQTARDALSFLRRSWGSVDGYLDWIGFDVIWRKRLRRKFLRDEYLDKHET